MSRPVVVYLHGFNSSPKALKAQQVEAYIRQHRLPVDYLRPIVPDRPDQAKDELWTLLASLDGRKVCLIGSSLGGFYATWLAEAFDCRAALVNPAVAAHHLMQRHLGRQQNPYSGEQYELTTTHMQTLQSLYFESVKNPARHLVLLQMGDEVLDAGRAKAYFADCRCIIEPGGNHRFEGFNRHLPEVFSWFELE